MGELKSSQQVMNHVYSPLVCCEELGIVSTYATLLLCSDKTPKLWQDPSQWPEKKERYLYHHIKVKTNNCFAIYTSSCIIYVIFLYAVILEGLHVVIRECKMITLITVWHRHLKNVYDFKQDSCLILN